MQLFFLAKLLAVQPCSLEVSPTGVWFLLAVPRQLARLWKDSFNPMLALEERTMPVVI